MPIHVWQQHPRSGSMRAGGSLYCLERDHVACSCSHLCFLSYLPLLLPWRLGLEWEPAMQPVVTPLLLYACERIRGRGCSLFSSCPASLVGPHCISPDCHLSPHNIWFSLQKKYHTTTPPPHHTTYLPFSPYLPCVVVYL